MAQLKGKELALFINTIKAFTNLMECKDPYTAGHQQRTQKIAVKIAKGIGLNKDQIIGLTMASLVHDIGKICIPAEILCKPSKLNEHEFGLIKMHPQIAAGILCKIKFPWPIASIVEQHHERIDGSGYPFGLKEEDILIEAKILAVADVIEAICSHRPYRPAFGKECAIYELTKGKGRIYNKEVVNCAIKVFADADYI